MKRVYIIHGWEGSPDINWFPWLKSQLEKRGFEVFVPQLPDSTNPKLDSWLTYLKKYTQNLGENTIFVGHSLGCITILRLLENLDKKVGGAVLVAGFVHDLDYEGYKGEVKNFFNEPINWDKIRQNCKRIIAINSKNDPYVNFDNSRLFKEELNAQIVVHDNMGHYNEAAGLKTFPELLDLISKL